MTDNDAFNAEVKQLLDAAEPLIAQYLAEVRRIGSHPSRSDRLSLAEMATTIRELRVALTSLGADTTALWALLPMQTTRIQ